MKKIFFATNATHLVRSANLPMLAAIYFLNNFPRWRSFTSK